jgi:hypothetical protein
MNTRERVMRDAVKKRFGYYFYPGGIYHGGWRIDGNALRYLEQEPSVDEMKVVWYPMCFLYSTGSTKFVPAFPDVEKPDWVATKKAYEHLVELSRQLLKELMTERGIPYDEKEAKKQSLYQRHGMYATFMLRCVPELCNTLKKDKPKWSNKAIKARVLRDWTKELRFRVESPQELIESCWPDCLTAKPKSSV